MTEGKELGGKNDQEEKTSIRDVKVRFWKGSWDLVWWSHDRFLICFQLPDKDSQLICRSKTKEGVTPFRFPFEPGMKLE